MSATTANFASNDNASSTETVKDTAAKMNTTTATTKVPSKAMYFLKVAGIFLFYFLAIAILVAAIHFGIPFIATLGLSAVMTTVAQVAFSAAMGCIGLGIGHVFSKIAASMFVKQAKAVAVAAA